MTNAPDSFDILISDSLDPYWNLAAEEYLLERAATASPTLLIWRSAPSVIIGKNQNPWRECPVPWLHKQGILLARRISGGGAVYHDEGNLNYTFIMSRTVYSADAIFDRLIAVVSDLGVTARRVNRTSLFVQDRKISGNAFCFRGQNALHHGTLLVASDLARVRQALSALPWVFDTRATSSIRSPVANLNEWDASLTWNRVRAAFIARCRSGKSIEPVEARVNEEEVSQNAATYRSNEWLYERTPVFEVNLPVPNDAGHEERVVTVERGTIVRIIGASSALEHTQESGWEGKPFAGLARLLSKQPDKDQVFQSQTGDAEE